MEFSKDGSLVAMVGSDGLLRIFDFAEERQVCRGTRHLFPSRRFTHVLYIFRLYDIFSGYFGKLLCLAWSPDNNYILVSRRNTMEDRLSNVMYHYVCMKDGRPRWSHYHLVSCWSVYCSPLSGAQIMGKEGVRNQIDNGSCFDSIVIGDGSCFWCSAMWWKGVSIC
jgi:WD40 repeat protein